MGQLKAQDVDWLAEAWLVSQSLVDLKEGPVIEQVPPGGLLGGEYKASKSRRWKIAPAVKMSLELCLQLLTLHLFHRLATAHKVKSPTNVDGTRWFHEITDPTELLTTWLYLQPSQKLGQQDTDAFLAAYRLASVLKDRYCNPVWKRELPLLIAGAAGKSASLRARENAQSLRGHRSTRLTKGIDRCLRRSAKATWKELLDDLSGDGVVIEWDIQTVRWLDYDDNVQTTDTGTFRNQVSRGKKAK